MDIVVSLTAHAAADAAAQQIATEIADAVTARSHATIALSGGSTPLPMLERLAALPLPWAAVHIFQVDERAVAATDASRNWLHQQPLTDRVPEANRHAMPVELPDADQTYAAEVQDVLGRQATFDVVHLGIGDDGHTASLFADDPALSAFDHDVVWTNEHRGHGRLTLTLPALARARHQVWLAAGSAKAAAVGALVEPGTRTPAGMVAAGAVATLFVDVDAAALVVS